MKESMRWRKVAGDLRAARLQLGIVVMVLALGIAGVVAALNARAILEREIAASFASARVPDLALWLERVEPAQLALVAGEEGVRSVDARRVINTRVAAADGTWMPMRLVIRPRQPPAAPGVVHLHGPARESADDALFIEQSGESLLDARARGTLRVRKTGGETATLPFAGFVHDPSIAPSTQERMIFAYATPGAAQRLGHGPDLDQLVVKMEYRASTSEAVAMGNRLADALTRVGPSPVRIEALSATHPHGPLMTAMLRILAVLSALAFMSSAALAGYLICAWMRREVRLIGVMKTLGARSSQVAAQYLALALPLVASALAIALPFGIAAGRALAAFEADVINIDVGSWEVPAILVWQELAAAIAIPLLAMAAPIARAAMMPPRAAIQDPGIGAPPATARLAARLVSFPRRMAWTLALRNLWRRPWRFLIMVIALGSGGALLLTSKTTYESLMAAADRALVQEGHDIEVFLQRPAPAAELEALAAAVPGVARAEAFRRAGVTIVSAKSGPDARVDVEGARFTLVGYPEGSRLFTLPVVEGRSPRGADEVLATRALLGFYPDLALGRAIDVKFRDRRASVRITGFVEQIGAPVMYAPPAAFDTLTALGDGPLAVRIKASSQDLVALAEALDQAFLDAGRAPAQIISRTLVRDSLDEHVGVVGGVMRMIALAAALVGAIVLVATAVFNVAERRREVGILRTLGATPERIRTVFLVEGIAITLAAIALAIAGSLAITRAMLDAAERSLLRVAVPMQFSLEGLAILAFGVLVMLAAVRIAIGRALRAPVREALAAE